MKTTQNRKLTAEEQACALLFLTTNQMFALSA